MSLYEQFRVEAAAFSAVVDATTDWDAPTPVAEWSARDVVNHLNWLFALLGSKGIAVEMPEPSLDPVQMWNNHALAAEKVISDQTLLDEVIVQDGAPTTVGALIEGFYIGELFMHRWDLARSQGLDPLWPDEQTAALASTLAPTVEHMAASGQFGAPSDPGDQVEPQRRLVQLIGRDPDWQPQPSRRAMSDAI